VKKFLVILLLIVYSASAIGTTINMHYCMNKISDWSFSSKKKDKCAKCGMSNNGCCKDEKKEIKISSDQQKAEYTQNVKFNLGAIIIHNFTNPTKNLFSINKPFIAYLHSPPLILQDNKQAFYSIFLI
jgi:hypothetical protein